MFTKDVMKNKKNKKSKKKTIQENESNLTQKFHYDETYTMCMCVYIAVVKMVDKRIGRFCSMIAHTV